MAISFFLRRGALGLCRLPTQAIAVTLVRTGDIKFKLTPTGRAEEQAGGSPACSVLRAVPEAGLYQVSAAHTGKSDCEGLRKSVRFELAPGPFTVQIADVPAVAIKVTVRKAD